MLTIIPAGNCFNKEWFIAISMEGNLQRKTRYFLEQAISATSNEQILQRAMSDFLQLATSVMSNEQISQQVTSDFLQRANFATSNEWFYNEIISTSNEQRVKSYVSNQLKQKTSMWQPS